MVVLLAACAAFPDADREVPDKAPAPASAREPALAPVVPAPPPRETPSAAAKPRVPVPTGKPALSPPPAPPVLKSAVPVPTVAVADIVGLGIDEVREKLGLPDETEERPPVRVWRYRGRGCILVVSFFPDVGGRFYRALDVGTGPEQQGANDAAERCLAEIARRRP